MQVNMQQAKTDLSKLVEAAEKGEEIILARNGTPVARIVPISKRQLGALDGEIQIQVEDWWKPLTDEEYNAFLEGKY
jgi:prevent-host-death family protein